MLARKDYSIPLFACHSTICAPTTSYAITKLSYELILQFRHAMFQTDVFDTPTLASGYIAHPSYIAVNNLSPEFKKERSFIKQISKDV